MKIARAFTTEGRDAYEGIAFRTTASEIRNPDGTTVFKLDTLEVPEAWSQVAADVTLVVEYPVPMQSVADQVRAAVSEAITELVGMSVAEINVAIVDVHIPGDDDSAETEGRVR